MFVIGTSRRSVAAQYFGRFRSEADIAADFMSTRPGKIYDSIAAFELEVAQTPAPQYDANFGFAPLSAPLAPAFGERGFDDRRIEIFRPHLPAGERDRMANLAAGAIAPEARHRADVGIGGSSATCDMEHGSAAHSRGNRDYRLSAKTIYPAPRQGGERLISIGCREMLRYYRLRTLLVLGGIERRRESRREPATAIG
jgi:hypothetical protein